MGAAVDFSLTAEQEKLVLRATAAGLEWRDFANGWDTMNKAPLAEVTARAAELGLIAITVPEEVGGLGLTVMDYVLVAEAAMRAGATWVVGEPMFRTSGPGVTMVMTSSNERAREKFLPDLVAARSGCAIALTEPDFGSDMSSIETTAVRDGDDYIINGEKKYITGALEDNLYATLVRFDDIPGARGVGIVIVEKGMPGFEMEEGPTYVGSRGIPHGDLRFTDVRVPAENFLFGPGEFVTLMKAFNMERMHNATASLALAHAAFDEALAYTQERRQFGRQIVEFQAVYHELAEMWASIESARFLVYRAAATAENGKVPLPEAVTIAKYVANNVMFDVSARAVILQGGHGTTTDCRAQRIHRDSLVCRVAGGSPQVMRNVIAQQLMPDRRFPQRPVAAPSIIG
jgi:butyryl-CoA dehydrogenase